MENNLFDPDSVTPEGGVYHANFSRDGIRINSDIIKQGIKYYTELERKNKIKCKKCESCNHESTTIEYKAWLLTRDLKNANYIFTESVFYDDPVTAIVLTVKFFLDK